MSNQQVIVIERAEGCTCGEVYLPSTQVGYCDAAGDWNECSHGSTVTVLDARVVECGTCGGDGNGPLRSFSASPGKETEITYFPCPDCLGVGKRLAPLNPKEADR